MGKKIKIIVGISLVFFTIIISSIGVAGFVFYQQKSQVANLTNPKFASTDPSVGSLGLPSNQTDPNVGGITITEVGRHSTESDCWMIIGGNVYDFTGFLSTHPGGKAVMLPYCGKEATNAFSTKDKNPATPHTVIAKDLLNSYFLGKLSSGSAAGDGQNLVLPTLAQGKRAAIPTAFIPGNTNTPVSGQNTTTLTSDEISRHSTSSDCWIIISGNVYAVSSYLSSHPGGSQVIANYCGRDATSAFNTKNSGSSHSSFAVSLLGNYLIGRVGAVVATVPSGSSQNSNTTILRSGSNTGNQNNTQPTVTPIPSSGGNNGGGSMSLTSAQVASHNTLQDCWIIVSNRVYDVTRYISSHPGGQSAILRHCGQESTTAFNTRDGSGSHSGNAVNLLNNYYIGDLGSSVPVNNPPSGGGGVVTATPTTPPSGGGGGSNLPAAILSRYPEATRISGNYEDDGRWEGRVNTSIGCRSIKTSSSGAITSDESCGGD